MSCKIITHVETYHTITQFHLGYMSMSLSKKKTFRDQVERFTHQGLIQILQGKCKKYLKVI